MLEIIISSAVLIVILIVASYFDIREKKIPNVLIVIGLVSGILIGFSGIRDLAWKLLACLILFFFGMLGMMGLGDIKLWMVMIFFMGIYKSVVAVAIAAGALVVFALIKRPKEAILIIKSTLIQIKHHMKPETIEQEAYPFAPFMTIGAIAVIIGGYLFETIH